MNVLSLVHFINSEKILYDEYFKLQDNKEKIYYLFIFPSLIRCFNLNQLINSDLKYAIFIIIFTLSYVKLENMYFSLLSRILVHLGLNNFYLCVLG